MAACWDLMHFALLSWLARDGDIDWSRTIVDSFPLARLYLDLLAIDAHRLDEGLNRRPEPPKPDR
jgi:hypothetical protein